MVFRESNSYLLEVPVGRVREEEESRDEEDGKCGGGDGHPVPASDGAQGVGQKGACFRKRNISFPIPH